MGYHKNSVLPSTTEILSPYSGLENVPEKYLTIASERGTRVHTYCASIALGEWIPSPEDDVKGYIESFKKWFNLFVNEVLLCEEEIEDKDLGYCGHPDLVVLSSKLNGIVLIDLKTPTSVKSTWGAQLAAYAQIIEKKKNINIGRLGSLRLKSDGRMAKFDEFTGQRSDCFKAFFAALIAYNFFKS